MKAIKNSKHYKVIRTFRLLIGLSASLAVLALNRTSAGQRVELPAGSTDGLAAAVAAAGEGGVVLIKKGVHLETTAVVVAIPVSIVGEAGAIIECGTSPGSSFPVTVAATLHVRDTENVRIQGLRFQPAGNGANCAVLIENSQKVRVFDNTISGFEYGIIVEHGDNAIISGNTVQINSSLLNPMGIVIINGASVQLTENSVSGAVFGIFAGDRDGRAFGNTVSNCFVGMILCHMPPGTLSISGQASGALSRCIDWVVEGNTATENAWGYEVIDGSHSNLLVNNAASANTEYDIELAGATGRYGFPAPPSYDNVVVAGSQKGLVVKDCGNADVILGQVVAVDHNSDPCN